MPFFWLSKNVKKVTLLKIEEGTEPVRDRFRRYLMKITDFNASVALRNTENSPQYNGEIRYIYNVAIMPSRSYRPEIHAGRIFMYGDLYLKIVSAEYNKATTLMECVAHTVDVSELLGEEVV